MRSSSTMINVPSRCTVGRGAARYSGTIGMDLPFDVLPDVEFGPVREREHSHGLVLRARTL